MQPARVDDLIMSRKFYFFGGGNNCGGKSLVDGGAVFPRNCAMISSMKCFRNPFLFGSSASVVNELVASLCRAFRGLGTNGQCLYHPTLPGLCHAGARGLSCGQHERRG